MWLYKEICIRIYGTPMERCNKTLVVTVEESLLKKNSNTKDGNIFDQDGIRNIVIFMCLYMY